MLALTIAVVLVGRQSVAAAAPQSNTAKVVGPTLVAFWPQVTPAQLESDQDLATTLDDFGWYLAGARKLLEGCHLNVLAYPGSSFRVVEAGRDTVFKVPAANPFGYYLKVPGKNPLVLWGVHTDADLAAEAASYFGCVVPKPTKDPR